MTTVSVGSRDDAFTVSVRTLIVSADWQRPRAVFEYWKSLRDLPVLARLQCIRYSSQCWLDRTILAAGERAGYAMKVDDVCEE